MNNISKKQFQQKVITSISQSLTENNVVHAVTIKEGEEEKDVFISINSFAVELSIISYYDSFVAQGEDLGDMANKLATKYSNSIIKFASQTKDTVEIDLDKLTQDDICLSIKNKEALRSDVTSKPFIGNLVMCYVVDLPEVRLHASNEILEKLKINPGDFLEKGLENLEHRLFSQDISNFSEFNMVLTYEIDNAASLLLFRKFWDLSLYKPNGDWILCIENQNTVHCTGSKSKLGIKLLQEKLTSYCPHLITLKDKKYLIFNTPKITEIGITEPGLIDPISAAMNRNK